MKIAEQYSGTVIAVDEEDGVVNSFVVLRTDQIEEGFLLEELSECDQAKVRIGATVNVTIGHEVSAGGVKRLVSEVRVA